MALCVGVVLNFEELTSATEYNVTKISQRTLHGRV